MSDLYEELFQRKEIQNWQEEQKEKRSRCFQIFDEGIEKIQHQPRMMKSYLDCLSVAVDLNKTIDRCGVYNAVLIMEQNPNAKMLDTLKGWKERNYSVDENYREEPIIIFESRQNKEKTKYYYNPKSVYDISQTTAKDQFVSSVNVDKRMILKSMTLNYPLPIIPVDAEKMPTGELGYYDVEKASLMIRKGMNEDQVFVGLAMAMSHAALAKGDAGYDNDEYAFITYCSTYALCKHYGIDRQQFSFHELPEYYPELNKEELKKELYDIKYAYVSVAKHIERNQKELQPLKEQAVRKHEARDRG